MTFVFYVVFGSFAIKKKNGEMRDTHGGWREKGVVRAPLASS